MLMVFAMQERAKDLAERLKSGDIYNEKILKLPKRKVPPFLPIATLYCSWYSRGDITHEIESKSPYLCLMDDCACMLSRYELVQMIAMLFTGTAPAYLMSTTHVLVEALLGAPMGAEFIAASWAAWQVCRTYQGLPC